MGRGFFEGVIYIFGCLELGYDFGRRRGIRVLIWSLVGVRIFFYSFFGRRFRSFGRFGRFSFNF